MAKAKKIQKLDLKIPTDFLQAILNAAENHGNEGEPDMEVGDLQDAIWDLWLAMPAEVRDVLMASEKWANFIANFNGRG